MIFSRVSVESRSCCPSSSEVLQIAGDVNFLKLSDEAVNRLGYFRLADTSPCPGEVSSTIDVAAYDQATRDNSPLPNISPPSRLKQTSDCPPIQLSRHELLHVTPNWATQGLCIDGFSSTTGKRIVSGESLGDITNSPLAFSTDPDDSSTSSSFSDRFFFPPSPDFEVPSPSSPFDNDDEEHLPDDFVGVLYVGYPLRPSPACYDLVGLGLPSNVIPDNRRERFGELDLTSPHFEKLVSSLVSPLQSKRRSSISLSHLNSTAVSQSSRDLYIIAEEENEGWETPRSLSLPCIRHACSHPPESPSNERTLTSESQ